MGASAKHFAPCLLPVAACTTSALAPLPPPPAAPSVETAPALPRPAIAVDEDPPGDVAPPSPARCGTDGWTTYAHDAARTSASGACLHGPLTVAWTFAPPAGQFRRASRVAHAIADGNAVFVQGTVGDSPALWRVSARTGEVEWAYDSHADIAKAAWPTLAPRTVLLVDDGMFLVDPLRGKNRGHDLDAWGQSLTDGEHLFIENTWQCDGWGPFVAEFDLDMKNLWRRDWLRSARGFAPPDVSGIALSDGILVHASHQAQRGMHVSAFTAGGGQKLWSEEVTPASAPSIAAGRVHGVERWRAERRDRLVARSLRTGQVLWTQLVADARGPAPVLAGGLVLVHAADGVHAFDAESGDPRWTAPLPRTADPVQSTTTLAAATGSGTLVVCTGGSVHVLRLADGADLWNRLVTSGPAPIDSPVIAEDALYVAAGGNLLRLEWHDAEPQALAR